jgi:hypothetical protein
MEFTEDEYNKLKEYAELEGSELEEAVNLLMSLHNYEDYIGEEFFKHLKIELKRQLNYFKNNSKIVEREYTTINKYKELDWISYENS